jgi:hypothetical protein
MRYRSYDFHPGDEFYLEGERVGYSACSTAYTDDGEPYDAYSEPVADLADLTGRRCIHMAIRVDAESPAWSDRIYGGSRKIGQIIYPPVSEDGMVVPIGPPDAPEPGTEHDWSDAADRVRAWLA